MPYTLFWKERYVVFEYFGEVSSDDLIASNQEVYGDERFDSLRWQVVLFDATETVAFNNTKIRLIAYMDQAAAQSNPHITIAFVGTSETLETVEAAYSVVSANPVWPLLRFDSREEAIAYISQSED